MTATLLPSDIYQVVNKCLLNENDKLVLNMLYMPIIGNTAITLYNILYNELKANNFISSELTHYHLMINIGDKLESIKEARIKLEAVGLLRTYYTEGSVNSYIYELYSPLTASEFFNHPIFNIVLYNNVGKEEYKRIRDYFKVPKLNLEGYTEITSEIDKVFDTRSYTNFEIENIDIVKKEKLNINYENEFDFDTLITSIPRSIINEKTFTKTNKELISALAFLYNIDVFKMSDIIKVSLNEKGLIDKELLRNNARKYYEYNNDGRLPTLVFKSEKKTKINKGSERDRIINVFETKNPKEFLMSKYKGVKPTERDMKILEMLVIDLKLNPSVVNVLIDYVLKTQNNRLVKSYIETIAGEWKREGIETASEAMDHAESLFNKNRKDKKITKTKEKEEKLPSWFDKSIEKEEIEDKDKEEIESFLKEYV